MGNKIASDESYGSVIIQTAKKTYFAGEQINGQVFLNLKKSFPADHLNLIIKGEKKVIFTERKTETERYYDTHSGIDEFFGYSFRLLNRDGYNFTSGQYSFPFSFKLLNDLPGSFIRVWQEDGYSNYGKIEYSIWAGIQSRENDKLKVFGCYDFYVDQIFNVLHETEKTDVRKVNIYCRDKELVEMNYAVDKSFFRVG